MDMDLDLDLNLDLGVQMRGFHPLITPLSTVSTASSLSQAS